MIFTGNTWVDAIVFTVGFVLILMIPFVINPRLFYNDMPAAIKAKAEPLNKKETIIGWILFAVLVFFGLGFLILSARGFDLKYAGRPGFWPLFWHLFWQVELANAVDLLILDWLLFATINPRWMSLPGTQGDPAYKEYKSHFIGFLIGTGLATVLAAVIGGIVYLS